MRVRTDGECGESAREEEEGRIERRSSPTSPRTGPTRGAAEAGASSWGGVCGFCGGGESSCDCSLPMAGGVQWEGVWGVCGVGVGGVG